MLTVIVISFAGIWSNVNLTMVLDEKSADHQSY